MKIAHFQNVASVILGLFLVLSPAAKAQQQLTIVKAVFGAGDVQRDVTPYVSAKVQGGQLQIKADSQSLGGDPAFGKVKTLTVYYRTTSGDFSIAAKENENLTIPNPNAVALAPANQIAAPVSQVSANPSLPSAPRRLAPDGVFYLLKNVSVTTDSGVMGFAPGTRVDRVGESDGKLKVKAGDQEFEVDKSSVTNDLDIAALAARQDNQSQAALAAWQNGQEAQVAKQAAQANAEAKASQDAEKMKAQAKEMRLAIIQVVSGGVLADPMQMDAPEGDSLASEGGGGYVSSVVSYSRSGKTIFVQGVNGAAEGQAVTVKAYRDGTFTYTTALGASSTVEKWVVVQ